MFPTEMNRIRRFKVEVNVASMRRAWKFLARLERSKSEITNKWAAAVLILYLVLLWITLISYKSGNRSISAADSVSTEKFFSNRRLFFCMSGGRAGSQFMGSVIGAARDVVALHEPEPKMNNHMLRDVILSGKRRETFTDRSRIKAGAIRNTLLGTATNVSYAESSHMFLKTYSDVVLFTLARFAHSVTILYLQRDLTDVIWSQLRLGWFSPHHSGRNNWYYALQDVHESELRNKEHVHQLIPHLNYSDPVDLLFGYNYDIALRGLAMMDFISKHQKNGYLQNVRVIRVNVKQFNKNDSENLERFISSLGLEPDRNRVRLLRFRDTNDRTAKKDRVVLRHSFDKIAARVHSLSQISSLDSAF